MASIAKPQRVMLYLRWASGLTQQALADKAGLSGAGLRFVETGQRRPRARTKAKIAKALGAAVEDVFPPDRQLVADAAKRLLELDQEAARLRAITEGPRT